MIVYGYGGIVNFKFKALVSENDYLDFKIFMSFKSPYGVRISLKPFFRLLAVNLIIFHLLDKLCDL